MPSDRPAIVSKYAWMWPREGFDAMEKNVLIVKNVAEELKSPGVYVL